MPCSSFRPRMDASLSPASTRITSTTSPRLLTASFARLPRDCRSRCSCYCQSNARLRNLIFFFFHIPLLLWSGETSVPLLFSVGLRNLSFFSLFFNLAWVVLVCFTLFSLFHSFTNGRSPRCTARRLCTLLLDCVGLLWVDRVVDCLLPFVDYRYPPDSSGRSELDAMDLGFEMNGGNGWGGGFTCYLTKGRNESLDFF